MSDTYRHAQTVIVIDNDMLNEGGNLMQHYQTFVLSDWMTRLWTYQEAYLAGPKLVFAYADVLLAYSILLTNDPLHKGLYQMVLDTTRDSGLFDPTFKIATGEGLPRNDALLHTAKSLHSRTTTRKQDEAICLATILGLSVHRLLDDLDLGDFFRLLEWIPETLIFAPGHRLTQPSLRALPSSFLARPSIPSFDPYSDRVARLTPKGLELRRNWLVLLEEFPHQVLHDERIHWINLVDEASLLQAVLVKYFSDDIGGDVNEGSITSNAAVILSHESANSFDNGHLTAILVEITCREHDKVYGHWLARLLVRPPDSTVQMDAMPSSSTVSFKVRREEQQAIYLD